MRRIQRSNTVNGWRITERQRAGRTGIDAAAVFPDGPARHCRPPSLDGRVVLTSLAANRGARHDRPPPPPAFHHRGPMTARGQRVIITRPAATRRPGNGSVVRVPHRSPAPLHSPSPTYRTRQYDFFLRAVHRVNHVYYTTYKVPTSQNRCYIKKIYHLGFLIYVNVNLCKIIKKKIQKYKTSSVSISAYYIGYRQFLRGKG